MDMLLIITLLALLEQCQGNTQLIYRKRKKGEGDDEYEDEDIELQCDGSGWQIDLDQDNKVDCNFTCSAVKDETKCDLEGLKCSGDFKNIEKSIKEEIKINMETSCKKQSTPPCLTLTLKKGFNGFFACVNNFKSTGLFPFKPSMDSFIVAFAEPKLVKPDVETNMSVIKQSGETVDLTCNFTMAKTYSNNPFTVYWIKTTSDKNSSCLYSYSFDVNHGLQYNHHCHIDEDLLNRLSNSSSIPLKKPNFHNLKIGNVTPSDSGQYVCALHVLKNQKGHWKVITNITVTVKENDILPSDKTPLSAQPGGDPLIPLYVVGVLLFLCLCVTATVILMRKRTETSQESQIMRMKRDQNGEETPDSDDCSPYAVGRREEEPYSVVTLSEVRKPTVTTQSGEGQAAVTAEPYSIVMLNTEYEASGPMHAQTTSTSGL